MLGWILNLSFAGGEGEIAVDANTLFVNYEDTTLHVTRGRYEIKTIYVDKDATKRISADWSDWLNGSSIASVVWEVENNSNIITLSDASNNSTVCVNYVAASVYDQEIFVKCTITTDDSPVEVEPRSFLVKTVRTF